MIALLSHLMLRISLEGRLEMQHNRGFACPTGDAIMKDAQKIALIASFFFGILMNNGTTNLPEWRGTPNPLGILNFAKVY